MKTIMKNILRGAGSILDISARDPIHPNDFFLFTRDRARAISRNLRDDRAKVGADMRKAWERVASINEK